MLGWSIAIGLIIAWKVSGASMLLLVVSGLFAIAGSIGFGLNSVAANMKK